MATMCATQRCGGAVLILLVMLASSSLPTMEASTHKPRKIVIAFPIFENMTMLDVVGPYEILHTLPYVEAVLVSFKRGPVTDIQRTMTLEAKATFDEVPSPDVVVVPGGLGTYGLLNNTVILNWIRKAHKTTIYTTSVCTGGLLMGAAGLLEGIDATTHWGSLPMLADYGANPVSIRVVRHGKIITSAGVSSGIDMAITLAALLSNKFDAQAAQLFNEYDPQPPFNTGTKSKASPELVAQALEWADGLYAIMNGTASL
ncbi:hypothetical protein KC19_8G075600 [Ceratodon purpureus]|uniref:DJ-1/PfpI domain-containing protein n=1 Tax=Ceratodon purpureus TaxID=3225 RepID=A0A8T0GZM5_CERPU|nr:hypothetical protein KC19_8G075600 [Ceratodon purpureus]